MTAAEAGIERRAVGPIVLEEIGDEQPALGLEDRPGRIGKETAGEM